MGLIENALEIALRVHREQKDKAGKPYIWHPLSVAMDPSLTTEEEQATGLLHDVMEDTDRQPFYEFEVIYNNVSPRVAYAVNALTRREAGKVYPSLLNKVFFDRTERFTQEKLEVYLSEYLSRVVVDPIARKVKRVDLLKNLDPTRMAILSDDELGRVKRYHRALRIVEEYQPIP